MRRRGLIEVLESCRRQMDWQSLVFLDAVLMQLTLVRLYSTLCSVHYYRPSLTLLALEGHHSAFCYIHRYRPSLDLKKIEHKEVVWLNSMLHSMLFYRQMKEQQSLFQKRKVNEGS